MKKFFTKEVVIAICVIVSGAMLVAGIEFLKGANVFKSSNYYYITYKNVDGLSVSTPVEVDGFKVGVVKAINFDYETCDQIEVEVSLDRELHVPKGSKAELSVDLMGVATVNLVLNKETNETHNVGEHLIGVNPVSLLSRLESEILPQVQEMLPKVNAILSNVEQITGDSAIGESLDHINNITRELEVSSVALTKLMKNDIPTILNNVDGITAKLDNFSTQLEGIDVEATMNSVNATLENMKQITTQLSSPDNTLGLLLNDKGLYNSLQSTVNSADSLMIDLKKNPKRYVHFSIW